MTSTPDSPSRPPAPEEAQAESQATLRVPSPAAGTTSEEDAEAKRALESLMAHRRRRRTKRVVALVVALAVVAAVAAFAALGSRQPDPSEAIVPTVTVTRQDYTESVKASGSVEPVESVQVTPEVDGIIQKVYVRQGDRVERGDPLLLIGNDALDKAVRDAELQLRSAKNQLRSARESYQAAYDAYYADETGSIDVSTVNSAADAVDAAQLALEGAQSSYDDAVASADKRTVLAPASGSVVVMNAVEGAQAGSGGTGAASKDSSGALIMIGDLSQMSVTVQVNELDIAKVQVGQPATATFSALPDLSLDAEVTNIASVSSSDASSAGYGGTVVTYAVRLLVPEPDASLKPGMTANVDITCASIPDALTVPASAIGTDADGASYVCVVTGWDGTVPATERRRVDVRASGGSDVVVEGDVSEGDEVLEDAQAEPGDAPAPSGVAA
ncbi:efflux RND transporter periplasmic adaptor subunit [Atopobiaceae bacterium HCP3S3_F7]